jgi:hypothetical protein
MLASVPYMFRFQNLIYVARSTLSDSLRDLVFDARDYYEPFPHLPYQRWGTTILCEKSQSSGQRIDDLNSMQLSIQYLPRDEVESILDGAGRAYWPDIEWK